MCGLVVVDAGGRERRGRSIDGSGGVLAVRFWICVAARHSRRVGHSFNTPSGGTGPRGHLGRDSPLLAARRCQRGHPTPLSSPPPARQHSVFRRGRLNAGLMREPDGSHGGGAGGGTARAPLLVASLTGRRVTRYGQRHDSPTCTGRPPRTARVAGVHSGASDRVRTGVTSHGGGRRQHRRMAAAADKQQGYTARPRVPRAATDVGALVIWVDCGVPEWSTHGVENCLAVLEHASHGCPLVHAAGGVCCRKTSRPVD